MTVTVISRWESTDYKAGRREGKEEGRSRPLPGSLVSPALALAPLGAGLAENLVGTMARRNAALQCIQSLAGHRKKTWRWMAGCAGPCGLCVP